jgi:hypothetical protein
VALEHAAEVRLVVEAAVHRDNRRGRAASQLAFGLFDSQLALIHRRRHAQLAVKSSGRCSRSELRFPRCAEDRHRSRTRCRQYSLVTVCHRRFMERLEIVNLRQPTEIREFSHGRLELFEVAGQVIGRASYEPGWRWSEHVGPLVGTDLCPTEHLGLVISGRCAVQMADGTETTMETWRSVRDPRRP